MKSLQQQLFDFQGKIKSLNRSGVLELGKQRFLPVITKIRTYPRTPKLSSLQQKMLVSLDRIKSIGYEETMEDYDKRKLGIFNQLNFFQLITGILGPVAGLINNTKLPGLSWLIACTPAFISILVLFLNARRKYDEALIAYFILYPVVTSVVYMSGMNLGMELFYILYGILSVFFLQEISQMLFSVALSMISYFILAVVWKEYRYQAQTYNLPFFLFNQILAIIFIFYGLFLIKKENAGYQANILAKNREIAENAELLKKQAEELTELNSLKNKLFSIIAHDIKSPLYALQAIFRNMQQYNLPANEIKKIIPEVVKDLTYTTGLMENLLQWAKSQMQTESVRRETVEISKTIKDVVQLLRLQTETKQVHVEIDNNTHLNVFGDKNMISLVLRNLVSNAVKFTPSKGYITISTKETIAGVQISVKDTGTGISEDSLRKIEQNNYYTTRGTASEPGTGLGLMLCKDFLSRNGSELHIESKEGEGSIFSFMLQPSYPPQ